MTLLALRSRLEQSPPQLDEGERLVLINDARRPIDKDLAERYGLDAGDVYDLYQYIDDHKEALLRGYLDTVDGFYGAFRKFVPSRHFSDNILLFHFSSKRTDVYPGFLRFCIFELRDEISGNLGPLRSDLNGVRRLPGFSLFGRLRLAIVAFLFLLKVILVRTALLLRRRAGRIADADVVFYTQYPRQSGPGFDNVNYGRVFNALSPDTRCVYALSALTDGIHDGPGFRELLRRSGAERQHGRQVWLMERAIDLRLVLKMSWLLLVYARVLLGLDSRKLSGLPADGLEIFRDELRHTVRRMFNYAYMLELSRSLARTVRDKVFVYYLFEHNYGKLLSFHLHDRNITVGCQHGTTSHLRLGQYMSAEELRTTTFPEYVISEGANHQKALELIHPGINIQLLGAPRVEHLAGIPVASSEKDSQETKVLIPLSLHGDLDILDYVVEAHKADAPVRFYVKPHPAGGSKQRDLVVEYLEAAGLTDTLAEASIYDEPLNNLLGRVDYVLFADTSVGIEFAEAGAIPVSAEPSERLDMCPLIDLGLFAPDVPKERYVVSRPAELLERLSSGSTKDSEQVIPENFYFAHLGSSTERWADFIRSQVGRAKGGAGSVVNR